MTQQSAEPRPALLRQWSAQLVTRGGVALNIRPAAPEDEQALLDFFAQATPEDLRFRFLTAMRAVGTQLAHHLVTVDHRRTENLLAFDARDGRLAASAMLAVDDRLDDAEVAIIVRSDLKDQGIGWTMLGHAADHAKAVGLRRIHSVELSDNRAAIALEEQQGFLARPCADDMSLTVLTKNLTGDRA